VSAVSLLDIAPLVGARMPTNHRKSRPQSTPFPAATRNLHLNNATSGATFTRTVQPSPGQDIIVSSS
jgi:hypothetical protein